MIFTSIEANEVYLTLFLAFDKMKQNVTVTKARDTIVHRLTAVI